MLWVLGGITVACMLYTFLVPYVHPDNMSLANNSLDAASFVFKAGFGFFVGLITGTTASRHQGV
jgi:hypothetical protein